MEARDRRAKMLSSAIDAFNREDFELAENYAQQVLREEPDKVSPPAHATARASPSSN